MDSGQWTVDSEQWSVNNDQWTVIIEKWSVNSDQWTVINKEWTVKIEQWTINSEQRTVISVQYSSILVATIRIKIKCHFKNLCAATALLSATYSQSTESGAILLQDCHVSVPRVPHFRATSFAIFMSRVPKCHVLLQQVPHFSATSVTISFRKCHTATF